MGPERLPTWCQEPVTEVVDTVMVQYRGFGRRRMSNLRYGYVLGSPQLLWWMVRVVSRSGWTSKLIMVIIRAVDLIASRCRGILGRSDAIGWAQHC